jgi:hypothetical protein
MLHVSPANVGEGLWVADHLREADREEIKHATGQHPRLVIEESIRNSKMAFTVRVTEESDPIAVFGVADQGLADGKAFGLENPTVLVGIVWLLGTDGLEANKLAVAHDSQHWIDILGHHYDVLFNVVWNENRLHIKWLNFSGFKFRDKVPWGPMDVEFLPFYKVTVST